MKLLFLGSGTFGRASLGALLEAGFAPALVVTQPLSRRRRAGPPEPTAVHAMAADAGIEVATPVRVNDGDALDQLRACAADLFVVSEYGQILSQELLDIPPLGAINVHASLLPRHRGATPVAASILAGDEETGITIQRVVRRLDAGPILATRRIAVEAADDASSLAERLAPLGGELVVEVVAAFEDGLAPPGEPQDDALATTCRRFSLADAWIDWSRPAAEIERQVRAMRPRPGAKARLLRDPPLDLIVRKARVLEGEAGVGIVAVLG